MHLTPNQLERARRATLLWNSRVDAGVAIKGGTPGVSQDSVG